MKRFQAELVLDVETAQTCRDKPLMLLIKDRFLTGWATIRYLRDDNVFIAVGDVEARFSPTDVRWYESGVVWLKGD